MQESKHHCKPFPGYPDALLAHVAFLTKCHPGGCTASAGIFSYILTDNYANRERSVRVKWLKENPNVASYQIDQVHEDFAALTEWRDTPWYIRITKFPDVLEWSHKD